MRSKSEIRRLIKQGAIELNNTVIRNGNIKLKDNDILKVGKKEFYKIRIV